MAQAKLEEKRISLSKCTSVCVTDNAQIEFTITPIKEDFMGKTFVYLTCPAWVSFCNSARKKICRLLKENGEDSWMYHPNSKYVSVNKKGQVSFQTMNRKSRLMKEHSVFLSAGEWVKLDESIEEINSMLDAVWSSKKGNLCSAGVLTTYKWRYHALLGGMEHKATVEYLDRRTAREAGTKYKSETPTSLGVMKIDTFVQTSLDPLKFMTVVYYTTLCKTISFMIKEMIGAKLLGDGTQYIPHEPISREDIVKFGSKHQKEINDLVHDELVERLFLNCWRRMKQGIIDAEGLIKSIHTVIFDEWWWILEMAGRYSEILDSDPQCILVSSVWEDIKMDNNIWLYMDYVAGDV